MSISLEGGRITISGEDAVQVKIPKTKVEIETWILKRFGLRIAVSVPFVKLFGGMTEFVRDKTFVLTKLKRLRHERDVFADDPDRPERRIIAVSEILSLLKFDYLADSRAMVRFWARDKDGQLVFPGINHEADGSLHLFTETAGCNRILIAGTITVITEED